MRSLLAARAGPKDGQGTSPRAREAQRPRAVSLLPLSLSALSSASNARTSESVIAPFRGTRGLMRWCVLWVCGRDSRRVNSKKRGGVESQGEVAPPPFVQSAEPRCRRLDGFFSVVSRSPPPLFCDPRVLGPLRQTRARRHITRRGAQMGRAQGTPAGAAAAAAAAGRARVLGGARRLAGRSPSRGPKRQKDAGAPRGGGALGTPLAPLLPVPSSYGVGPLYVSSTASKKRQQQQRHAGDGNTRNKTSNRRPNPGVSFIRTRQKTRPKRRRRARNHPTDTRPHRPIE